MKVTPNGERKWLFMVLMNVRVSKVPVNRVLMMILHCLLNNSEEPFETKKMVVGGLANLQLNGRTSIKKRIINVILEKVTVVC